MFNLFWMEEAMMKSDELMDAFIRKVKGMSGVGRRWF